MTLLDRTIVRLLPIVPTNVVERVSSPYIAGATVEDAVSTCRELSLTHRSATLDVLGEEVRNRYEAEAVRDEYISLIAAIREHALDATVSIKPSALGLRRSYAVCRSNLREILAYGMFVRLDMEDASLTDRTLRLYGELRRTGHDNIGLAVQAYLHRTLDDVRGLAHFRPNIRLCKGIYNESPAIALKDRAAIRSNYIRILDQLASMEGSHIAIATHDETLIKAAAAELPPSYEFEMLLGVRDRRARELALDGHPVRIYVPFGRDWYAYSIRRLQENPAMARTVARATVGRLFTRTWNRLDEGRRKEE